MHICKREYEKENPYSFNERPVEFRFVFQQLSKIYPEKVLDVGTGTTALPSLIRNCGFTVTAIDNIKDYWPSGMFNRHCYVLDDDITDTKLDEKFDLITCVSVLEHIENHNKAIANMFNLLNDQGYIVLTCPYNENEYIKNVYDLPGSTCGQNAPYICQSFSRSKLDKYLEMHDATIIEQEYWKFWEGEYWTEGDEVIPPIKSRKDGSHQLTCLLIQKTGS